MPAINATANQAGSIVTSANSLGMVTSVLLVQVVYGLLGGAGSRQVVEPLNHQREEDDDGRADRPRGIPDPAVDQQGPGDSRADQPVPCQWVHVRTSSAWT